MLIGTLAITGVGIPLTYIGFAGFLSKDAVIESAFAGGTQASMFAFWVLVLSALFTSFYSWRLMFLTFWGEPRGDHHTHDHAHESPKTMLAPLGCWRWARSSRAWSGEKDFFGHANEVALLRRSLPRRARMARRLHGEGDDGAAAGTTHYASPAPGRARSSSRPDNTVLDDAHEVPKWVKVAPFAPC
jgi:NADH-quinone oxidoreductase subunit L